MDYAPIKKQRVFEMIIDRIKDSIQRGILQPGDKLPSERELSQILSVSRGALREAISVLEAKGIVEVQPGKGIFLVQNSQTDLLQLLTSTFNGERTHLIELLELRQSLESHAAYFAAQRRTEQDLETIKAALARLENSINNQEVAAQEDYDFHFAVIKASHNSMMVHTLRLISEAIIRGLHDARLEALMIPGKTKMVLEEHWEILRAIQNQHPEQARGAMLKHLENVKLQEMELINLE